MSKQKIIIANWKMKLNMVESLELAKKYTEMIAPTGKEVVVCPSEAVLSEVDEIIKDSAVKLGAQNVFWEERGAYTGEVSAGILEEAGCEYAIVGHSERRQHLLENYEMIHQKVKAVLDHSRMIPILCIGETLEDKEADKRDYVIVDQIQQALGGLHILKERELIVAYEPIWAIGTGQIIKPEDAVNMHEIIGAALRDLFGLDIVKNQIRIIYGGSVDSKNVKEFSGLDNVDGLLVGGASLKAEEFNKIVEEI